MIKRRYYKKRSRKKKRDGTTAKPLMLNIRVRHVRRRGEPRSMASDVKAALQQLLDTGKMPPGWQFMYVDWKNPEKFGGDWDDEYPPRNHTDDSDHFYEHFRFAVQAAIRVAIVRKL